MKSMAFVNAGLFGVPPDVEYVKKVFREVTIYNAQSRRIARWGRRRILGSIGEAMAKGIGEIFK